MTTLPIPPIRVDVSATGAIMNEGALTESLARALETLRPAAPVVALVHGYRFQPGLPGHCPHGHILSVSPPPQDRSAISWPRHLGLDGQRGLAIAFGWEAKCSLWTAYRRAGFAGAALAQLAALVRQVAPGRRLDVVAHSLGARVALAALPHAAPGDLRRLILLASAEGRGPALAALGSAAGRRAEVINVTTRENDLFDFLFEWLVHGGRETAVGQGLGVALPNWRDLRIDQTATRNALGRLGHSLPAPPGRVSHWSPYLRPGVFALYRALLAGDLPASALPVAGKDRRWSRFLALPRLPLPFRTDPA